MKRLGIVSNVVHLQRYIERNDRKRECRITETEHRNAELPRLAFVPFIELTPDSKYRMMEVSQ